MNGLENFKMVLYLINTLFKFYSYILATFQKLKLHFCILELKFYLDKQCMKGYKFSRDVLFGLERRSKSRGDDVKKGVIAGKWSAFGREMQGLLC